VLPAVLESKVLVENTRHHTEHEEEEEAEVDGDPDVIEAPIHIFADTFIHEGIPPAHHIRAGQTKVNGVDRSVDFLHQKPTRIRQSYIMSGCGHI
jgi:hypothetical protein